MSKFVTEGNGSLVSELGWSAVQFQILKHMHHWRQLHSGTRYKVLSFSPLEESASKKPPVKTSGVRTT